MAIAYTGVNYADTVASIPTLIDEGNYRHSRKHIIDTFVFTADLAAGDTILMGSIIPQNSILIDCLVTTGALGGSCTIDVGWKVSDDGTTVASATGFFSALPVSSATVAAAHGSTYEGSFYLTQIAGAVQPVIAEHAVSSGATGKTIAIDVVFMEA